MSNDKKSSVISRLNSKWEATITISLPLHVLAKVAKMATKAKCAPVEIIKQFITECVSEGK